MDNPTPIRPDSSFEEAERLPNRSNLRLPMYEVRLTKVILVLNGMLFVLLTLFAENGLLNAIMNGADGFTLVLFGAKHNELISNGQYWRLLTPIFLHIGLMHLLFNEFALAIFGREVESLFGTARFAAIYLLTGLFGSLASFAFSPSISAGASGAIFGIIGTMVAYLFRNRKEFGERGREHLRGLLIMIGLNIFLGVTVPGIDNYGHMGGLFSGLILGAILSPTYALQQMRNPASFEIVEQPPIVAAPLVIVLTVCLLLAGIRLAMGITPY